MGYRAPAEGADRLRPPWPVIPWAAQRSWDHCSRVRGWGVKDLIVLRFAMALSRETLPSFFGSGNVMEPSFRRSWPTATAPAPFIGKRLVNGQAIKQPMSLLRLCLRVRRTPIEFRFSFLIMRFFSNLVGKKDSGSQGVWGTGYLSGSYPSNSPLVQLGEYDGSGGHATFQRATLWANLLIAGTISHPFRSIHGPFYQRSASTLSGPMLKPHNMHHIR